MNPAETIDVWTIALGQPIEIVDRCYQRLPIDEQAKADRYKVEPARRAFTLARWALRTKLAEQLDCKPQEVRFSYGEFEKPHLAEPASEGIGFNVSHSGDWAVGAIGPFEYLGVDIEKLRPVNNLESLARTVFSEYELKEWLARPEDSRSQELFRKWTQKEACLKAVGVGLSNAMTKFQVLEENGTLNLDAPPGSLADAFPWSLRTYSHIDGHVVSLAIGRCSELSPINFREFEFTSG